MTLLNEIKKNQLSARKAKASTDVSLLTTLIGDVEAVGKNAGREVTDTDVVAVVKKFIKGAEETIAVATKHNDDQRLGTAVYELAILRGYLPQQLAEDQLTAIVGHYLADAPGAKLGDVLKRLKTEYAGQYDGALATTVVKKLLS